MIRKPTLVLSLDFELHWGVFDREGALTGYRDNLLGAREAVPRMLALFEQYGVHVTWATVGLLFARSREERERYLPAVRPAYRNAALDPYRVAVGDGEEDDDPLHYAPSLIEQIAATPGQEVATHTFGHFYCLEDGATPEAFATDLKSAVRIAEARGIELRSIVFPRNQVDPRFLAVLPAHGITCYRGNPDHAFYRAGESGLLHRAGRLADSYLNLTGHHTTAWADVLHESGLANVPGSRFLRPPTPRLAALEPLKLRRITRSMTHAARTGRIFHLWWHPHNFGRHLDESLTALRHILAHYRELRERYGMASLGMAEVAALANGEVVLDVGDPDDGR